MVLPPAGLSTGTDPTPWSMVTLSALVLSQLRVEVPPSRMLLASVPQVMVVASTVTEVLFRS